MSLYGLGTTETADLLRMIESRLFSPRPDCLLWPGSLNRGYGQIEIGGAAKRIHRVVWEIKNGPIPDDLTIDHLCRVRSCCNTEHMELVTAEENKARAATQWRRVCRNGHARTPENTYTATDGRKTCRECRRTTKRRARQKARAAKAT